MDLDNNKQGRFKKINHEFYDGMKKKSTITKGS
jgi:hypothetical protein